MQHLEQILDSSNNVIYELTRSLGSEIQVGDTVKLWSCELEVAQLSPYDGPFRYLFTHGARTARFADDKGTVTIDNDNIYEINSRVPPSPRPPARQALSDRRAA